MQSKYNIRFIHRSEVFNICCSPRSILIGEATQQMLNTENLWMNVIIAHSKFISSSFICLFYISSSFICQSFLHLSSPYIDNIVTAVVEINA